MDTTQKPHLSHISLCFGYGGIDLGLHRIFGDRLRLAAVCEIEAFALENALSKMEAGLLPPAPIWNDLRTFPWEEFQNVSLVSGGFPCQPFSAAGKRDGDQDPRHLFPYIIDGIKRCRPRLVFLENVEGIISSKLTGEGWADPAGTPVLLHVLRELERVGYKATAGIFSASEVGAPHQRKRVFIMAHNNSERIKEFNRGVTVQSLSTTIGDCCIDAWPSRPGEQQYAWEPTRVVGNPSSERLHRGTQDGTGIQPEMLGEGYEAVGDPTNGRWRQCNSEVGSVSQPNEGCADTSECSETEFSMGDPVDEPSIGVDISELSGLSNSELAKICEWMVKTDNRTDELRLLGNGVVPATATRAFLTLLEKLNK